MRLSSVTMAQLSSYSHNQRRKEEESKEPIEALAVSMEGDMELGDMKEEMPVAHAQQQAVPLTPRTASRVENNDDVPLASVANVPGVVVEKIRESPRSCCAGVGCFFVLLTFLIAFLFIPRAPSVRLRRITFSDENDDEFGLSTSVKFTSRTLVQAAWRRLDVDLEWLRRDTGSVDIATLTDGQSFRTKAFGSKNIDVADLDDPNEQNLKELKIACQADGSAMLRLRGHIRTDDTKFRIESDWRQTTCR